MKYPSIITALTLCTLPAHAAPAVLLSTAAERVAAEYPAGQIVSAPLFVASGCDAGVFGVELTLLAGSDDFVVRSVTFNPAFSQELGEVSPAVTNAPAAQASDAAAPSVEAAGATSAPVSPLFRAVRSQAAAALDRTLGAGGSPVPFATVELEIRNPRPFTSALVVHYRGSLVGAGADGAAASDNSTTNPGDAAPAGESSPIDTAADVGRLVIEIVNTAPLPAAPAVEVWQQDQAALSAEVRDPATGLAVTTLVAGREYDLYYDAHGEAVSGYVLFTIAAEPGHSLTAAHAPAGGDWAASGAFAFSPDAPAGESPPTAEGYSAGMYRYASVGDDLMATGSAAAPSGRLLTFTPEGPGPLRMQLFMRNIDPVAQSIVEMETKVEVSVE